MSSIHKHIILATRCQSHIYHKPVNKLSNCVLHTMRAFVRVFALFLVASFANAFTSQGPRGASSSRLFAAPAPAPSHPLARRAADHFGSSDVWLRRSSEDEAERHDWHVVACAAFRRGLQAKRALGASAHFSHVETIHADKTTDQTCFLLVRALPSPGGGSVDSEELAKLAADLRLVSWNLLHPLLKVRALLFFVVIFPLLLW